MQPAALMLMHLANVKGSWVQEVCWQTYLKGMEGWDETGEGNHNLMAEHMFNIPSISS